MKKLIVILVCIGLLAFAGIGSSTVISFDDITIPNPSSSSFKIPSSYAGFNWTWYGAGDGGWSVIDDVRVTTWGAPASPSVGTIAAFNAYASNALWIESSSLFNFTSAEFAAQGDYGPEFIKVSAYYDDTLLGYVEMALSGSNYATLYGSSAMVGANRLKLTYTPYNEAQTGFWLMDNFAYNEEYNGNGEVPIPEPATLILIGLGLIGLGLARRR